MSNAAKVSVIVPVYNVKEYLPCCLESCMKQTLYDIEIICVDDGSTDGSGELLDVYKELDPRFQVIHKPNGGLSSARNAGCDAATGQWIMYLDSDDYLEENACERIWIESMEGDTDIVIFGSKTFPNIPKADAWYDSVLHVQSRRFNEFTPDVLFSTPGARPFVWRQAFSSEFLKETGIRFDEEAKFGEDLIYQMKAFPMATHFAFISDELYHYRWYREDSLMGKLKNQPDEKMKQHILMVEEITRYWKEKELLDRYSVEYVDWLLNFIVPDLTNLKMEQSSTFAAALKSLIEKYGLDQAIPNEQMEIKELWNKLKKLC